MLNKIKMFLLTIEGLTAGETHDSGSLYFNIKNTVIRLSEHMSIKWNPPTTLNIIVNGDTFAAFFGNQLLPINNFEELRSFIDNFVMICDLLQPFLKTKIRFDKPTPAVKYVTIQPTDDDLVSVAGLNDKQKAGIRKMIGDWLNK